MTSEPRELVTSGRLLENSVMVASSVSTPEVDLWDMINETRESISEPGERENEQLIVSDFVSPGCTNGIDDVMFRSEFTLRLEAVEV